MSKSVEDVLSNMESSLRKRLKSADNLVTGRLELPSLALTKALGGGIGYGRITTIHGSKSAGKSSMMMQAVGEAQREGKVCAWIDAEKTFDPEWASRLGVDCSELIVDTANDMYQCGDVAVGLIKAGVDVLVIDSVSALIQPSFLDDDGELAGMDSTKKIGSFSQGFKALIRSINFVIDTTAVILISQQTTYIANNYTKQIPEGGNAIEFYSSTVIRLNSTPSKSIKKEFKRGNKKYTEVVGREVEWTVQFNKLGVDGKTGKYQFYHTGDDLGIDQRLELLSLATQYGVVEQSGAWYKYNDEKFHGADKAIEWLSDDDNFKELKAATL